MQSNISVFFFIVNAFCDLRIYACSKIKNKFSYITLLLIYLSHLALRASWKYLFYIVWGWGQDSFFSPMWINHLSCPSYWKDHPFSSLLYSVNTVTNQTMSSVYLYMWVSFWTLLLSWPNGLFLSQYHSLI